jgi:hypothetical protein
MRGYVSSSFLSVSFQQSVATKVYDCKTLNSNPRIGPFNRESEGPGVRGLPRHFNNNIENPSLAVALDVAGDPPFDNGPPVVVSTTPVTTVATLADL